MKKPRQLASWMASRRCPGFPHCCVAPTTGTRSMFFTPAEGGGGESVVEDNLEPQTLNRRPRPVESCCTYSLKATLTKGSHIVIMAVDGKKMVTCGYPFTSLRTAMVMMTTMMMKRRRRIMRWTISGLGPRDYACLVVCSTSDYVE